jgi:hypothetical protein
MTEISKDAELWQVIEKIDLYLKHNSMRISAEEILRLKAARLLLVDVFKIERLRKKLEGKSHGKISPFRAPAKPKPGVRRQYRPKKTR